ncbi:MAG: KpsF/GutQ family sugar-phosphate isomerase [Candidatus Mcinerneyibacterium aminivorans]|jgi:arabinose-5-phosphate isomerase|uniref:KpsF/GutQ family sugar-phosphate isomerase n=1 Tax=Candidatus Mcinerneyibacterium aminivorans TaxID=2703815 RepID=A0A5D0MD67_9BACT|nr:MAG: KpsF/GutQ family sugar-phosphate isomerase [Candidatus Mcinerneyibacterium aminivorans]
MKEIAREVLDIELRELKRLYDRIDDNFIKVVNTIKNIDGSVVVTGMGKSGLVGRKISATLASTGTPSFFLHPAEASHGDLGMVRKEDLVLAISNSGETEELVGILPVLKRMGVKIIAMTGNKDSELARYSDLVIDISVKEEACPLDLAPTASTSTTLVMGDMLAITLLKMKGFKEEDFALYHPGGTLGKKLLLKVEDLMHTGKEIPKVKAETLLKDAIYEIMTKGFGVTTVVNDKNQLLGIFTDGDFKRTFAEYGEMNELKMKEVMTENPKTIGKDRMAEYALKIMEDNQITSLVVLDEDKKVEGLIHMHDLLKAGVV